MLFELLTEATPTIALANDVAFNSMCKPKNLVAIQKRHLANWVNLIKLASATWHARHLHMLTSTVSGQQRTLVPQHIGDDSRNYGNYGVRWPSIVIVIML